MDNEQRNLKIVSYGNAYAELLAALEQFPREMWLSRDEHGCWSIHEHIVHITDSEVNSYVRCRRLISEPGSELMAYDENQWATSLEYHSQSTDDSLQLFRWLRHQSHSLIRSLPASA